MAKKVLITQERTVNTYADLGHATRCLRQTATTVEEGSFYTEMASLLFSAFTLEAYLNHVGELLIQYWDEIDRLSYSKKLKIITTHTNINPDASQRPYQTIKSLFRFRNSIAHGRSQILKPDPKVTDVHDNLSDYGKPTTDWEDYCNIDNVNIAIDDVEQIITEIHKAAQLGDNPMQNLGFTSGSMSLLHKESNEN
ncbi:MAG: hypothetical protein KZQ82_19945 [Candidatus Thiodiazotropha sp. (ex Lucinoma annulata)]|nr:hypothetical protein [Candidatus Thiodiazotropha sp. (ex Lucinoma annulata)]